MDFADPAVWSSEGEGSARIVVASRLSDLAAENLSCASWGRFGGKIPLRMTYVVLTRNVPEPWRSQVEGPYDGGQRRCCKEEYLRPHAANQIRSAVLKMLADVRSLGPRERAPQDDNLGANGGLATRSHQSENGGTPVSRRF